MLWKQRVFLNNTAERRLYINREVVRMDRESQLEDAHEDGVKKGIEKGIVSNTIYSLNNVMSKQHFLYQKPWIYWGFQKISEKLSVKKWKIILLNAISSC